MRTSGGVDGPLRRLRGATAGPLHPLLALLLTLLFLSSLVAAESASQPHHAWNQQVSLDGHVTVGADGIATSRGAGRRRSDGLTITRSIPVERSITSDAAVDNQAIKFTPASVELGQLETCTPQSNYVAVENRGRISVRLDGADFTHEGFSLANDVRGIRLDPGDRFNVQFVFLPSEIEPNGVDAHLRLFTTSGLFSLPIRSPEVVLNRYGVAAIWASVPVGVRFGQSLQFVNPLNRTIRITEMYAMDSFVHLEMLNSSNWIGPRWPREGDDNEEEEIPGEYDLQRDYTRRADRGAWDMPAGTTSPLVKVSLKANTPVGEYFTYIQIAAGEQRLLTVPVRIAVLKPGIHIEPKVLDMGVLTDLRDDEHFETSFALYNAGVNPIEILELKILESRNLLVGAQLSGESSVIPPRTQVFDALTVQVRYGKDTASTCFASLLLTTNASSSELGQRKLKLFGRVAHGNVAFQLNETRFGVVMPLENDLHDAESVAANETDAEQTIPSRKLVSNIGENSSRGVMAGTTAFRKLQLWNKYDSPVELQRVWVELPNQDELMVYRFKQGIVPAGSPWPKISLRIAPHLESKLKLLSVRTYFLMVETNVSLHRIRISVYHGLLNVNSIRSLENYSVSGYYDERKPSECLAVPKGGLVTTELPRIDGGKGAISTQAVQICRSLLVDLQKVASHRSRTEVVTMTNENPVPLRMKIANVAGNDSVDLSITVDVALARSDASVSEQARYWSNAFGHNLSNNSASSLFSGGSFVLQPGYQVEFSVKVQAKDKRGELTVPIMTVETPVEVFHFYARLRSVQGTVEPVTPAIILPSMFPGRAKVIHLQYRNTFDHSVTPLGATLSSSTLKLLSMRGEMAPKRVENVLALLFSPAESTKCSDSMFLADCLLPLPETDDTQTCEQLSGYGAFVDKHDLEALRRRDAYWSRTQGSVVEAHVHLQTDIMEDVGNVTVKALLERPLVTTTLPHSSIGTFERKEFPLTELLELSHVFVNVWNPSNISIQMELTIAESEQELFYSCQGDQTNNNSVDTDDNSEGISSRCLAVWKAASVAAVTLQRDNREDIDVPSFYFPRQIVQVPAGAEAQLGPIYYLPSKVQEVTSTVFVRNDLSHIEPVPLFARSGKGILELLIDTPADSDKTLLVPKDLVGNAADRGYDGKLIFDVTKADASTDYTQTTNILLSNAGPFGLEIHSVKVEEPEGMMPSSTVSRMSEFQVALEHPRQENGGNGRFVLPPDKSARVRVSFSASCFSFGVTSWLIVDTSDSIKRIQLQGTIARDVAFSCQHSRMTVLLRNALYCAWIVATALAVISVLYTSFILLCGTRTHVTVLQKTQFLQLDDSKTKLNPVEHREELTASKTDGEEKGELRSFASITSLLEEMEQAAFTPSTRVVTPAVSELLEKRHKGLCSSVQGGLPLGNSANAETTEDPVLLSLKSERISPSVEAFTTTEEGLPSVQGEVVSSSIPSANTPQVSISKASNKVVGCSNDHKEDNDLSSNESNPEGVFDSGSSSYLTVAQPDAEELSADLPNLSFGDQLKLGPRSSEATGGPFEAFESLSARWRAEDQRHSLSELSPSLSGDFADWNDTLSLGTLGQGLLDSTTGGTPQHDKNVRSGSRSESSSFVGTPGLYLDEFSAFAAPTSSLSSGTASKANTKLAPPGFTPTDAKPLEVRAAFEQLRSSSGAVPSVGSASNSTDSFGDSSLFASKLPLFGPALPPTSEGHVNLGGVGRIGSGRSKVFRSLEPK
ncbi:hypothetical protein V7S43_003312 [Phytophthora oleae]|uniref:Transmembrane protein n=1 Tax=Phytophthora oleae TaxID=2107226 RepID=A0ABD3FYJ3_9STRA